MPAAAFHQQFTGLITTVVIVDIHIWAFEALRWTADEHGGLIEPFEHIGELTALMKTRHHHAFSAGALQQLLEPLGVIGLGQNQERQQVLPSERHTQLAENAGQEVITEQEVRGLVHHQCHYVAMPTGQTPRRRIRHEMQCLGSLLNLPPGRFGRRAATQCTRRGRNGDAGALRHITYGDDGLAFLLFHDRCPPLVGLIRPAASSEATGTTPS